MRPAAWFALVGVLVAGCDALLNIPSQESYEGDGGPYLDATIPADAALDVATSDAEGGQDAALADRGQAETEAGEGEAAAESGPDCGTAFDPDWANWPMPNSDLDIEAGSPNPESYTDNLDGTVTDDVTGLMWQQTPAISKLAWSDAKNYCTALRLAGHADWGLPSYVELVSLLNYGPTTPAVNAKYFPGTPQYPFWSSTAFTANPTMIMPSAWYVEFGYGSTSNSLLSDTFYVRCVRRTLP
jgi:hypothetical protein